MPFQKGGSDLVTNVQRAIDFNFSEPPPEGGLDLVTNRQGAIESASAESPGPDWKPGSGFI